MSTSPRDQLYYRVIDVRSTCDQSPLRPRSRPSISRDDPPTVPSCSSSRPRSHRATNSTRARKSDAKSHCAQSKSQPTLTPSSHLGKYAILRLGRRLFRHGPAELRRSDGVEVEPKRTKFVLAFDPRITRALRPRRERGHSCIEKCLNSTHNLETRVVVADRELKDAASPAYIVSD